MLGTMERIMLPFGTTHQITITLTFIQITTTILTTQTTITTTDTPHSLPMQVGLVVQGDLVEQQVLEPQQELVGQANEEALEVAVR